MKKRLTAILGGLLMVAACSSPIAPGDVNEEQQEPEPEGPVEGGLVDLAGIQGLDTLTIVDFDLV